MEIKIKNCNCIYEAKIHIQENALNIKYGANGTGKTSVCKAILAKAKESQEEFMELRPYGISEEDEEHQPMVSDMPFSNVRVFDEFCSGIVNL